MKCPKKKDEKKRLKRNTQPLINPYVVKYNCLYVNYLNFTHNLI